MVMDSTVPSFCSTRRVRALSRSPGGGRVGAGGVVVVLAICLTPFLRLALQYLLYKGAAALCATVAQPRLAALIDDVGSAFGLVLGMTGAGALVLLVSLVSAVAAVAP